MIQKACRPSTRAVEQEIDEDEMDGGDGDDDKMDSGLEESELRQRRLKMNKRWWIEFVEHRYFHNACSMVVVVSVMCLGIEADGATRGGVSNAVVDVWDDVFTVLFVCEMVLRMYAYGSDFFINEQAFWNLSDLLLVACQFLGRVPEPRWMRSWGLGPRFLRNMRIMRVLRLCRFVTEMRVLLMVIAGSFRSTFWTIALLVLLTYSVSVWLLLAIKDRDAHEPFTGEERQAVDTYFGSVSRTMWTLYCSISGGITWGDGSGPAPTLYALISPAALPFYGLYIAFMVFVFLNIITGIFLNTAILTTEDINHKSMMDQIRRIFKDADSDQSGAVSLEEFKSLLGNHELGLYLRGIGWRAEQAEDLFNMLDDDKSGEINIDEFISGCTRLQGQTKAIDFAAFLASFHEMADRLDGHITFTESRLEEIRREFRITKASLDSRLSRALA